MRNRKWDKRELVDAVLYLVDNGYKWRALPHDFLNWKTVYTSLSRNIKNLKNLLIFVTSLLQPINKPVIINNNSENEN